MISRHVLTLSALLVWMAVSVPAASADEQADLAAFFAANCSKCHGEKVMKGGIDLSTYTKFKADTIAAWQDVINNLERGNMPPKSAAQPSAETRQRAVAIIRSKLDRLAVDLGSRDFRLTRLTNQQIAWSLRDILHIDRDYTADLVTDPLGKHGESVQSTLGLTGGQLEVYLGVLQRAARDAVPDLQHPPRKYELHGNDWEKQHYLNRNDLAFSQTRHHKRYRGPKWLGDAFQIPLPPNYFFRIYVDDNRSEGQFRVRIHLRNEPPQQGGPLAKHEMTVFMDKGFKSSMHAVDSFTVPAKSGTQVFEVFGNVLDFPGVDPGPIPVGEDPYGTRAHFHYRFISVQNCSPLKSKFDKPVKNLDWVIHGDGHLVRADDQWIDAWGEKFGTDHWLKRSHGGSDHPTRGTPSVYKQVMKDTSYVVIEKIEFDLPWQWPPKSVEPFLKAGKLDDSAIRTEVHRVAAKAWRHPLLPRETEQLDSLITKTLQTAETKADALRDLLVNVFADARFLFLTDVAKDTRQQNHELIGRLAAYLWRSSPDTELTQLADRFADKGVNIPDAELQAQTRRMLADAKSSRFIQEFATSYFAFNKFDQLAINPNYYPWWNPHYKHYMKLEAIAFLETLLRENLSCLNCLSSDFVVVNDMMAKYYGIPKPQSGHRFSRVPAPPHRGGVLTMPAVLLTQSTGEDAHVVNRGVWVRGRLLGDPPRDPPPALPSLNEVSANPDIANFSVRKRLEAHRIGTCADCHKNIDPWGLGLESFDATGKYREEILRIVPTQKEPLRLPVVQDTVIHGIKLNDSDDLRQMMRTKCTADFARGFASLMLSHAIGRPLCYKEANAVTSLAKQFQEHDYRMADLIQAIVVSAEFRHPNGVAK